MLNPTLDNQKQELSARSGRTEAELRQVLIDWNRTECDYPHDKCLHELIEAQAECLPGNLAAVFGDTQLTYKEFNHRANQLAHYLQGHGVRKSAKVGICLEPSLDFAIAVFAVLKAGAACVPLDPNYPKERLAYMLQDVQAEVLITNEGLLSEGAPAGCQTVLLSDHVNSIAGQPDRNLDSGATPEDIAYVIYTSGSTGKPRGVLLTHAGLVNYNFNAARMYGITPRDRVLQFCSVSFDIAIEEMFITWLSGATLVLRTEDMPLAVPEFVEWAEQQRISVVDLPTAYWHEWVHDLAELKKATPRDLRLVIVGGEKPSSLAYATWLERVGRGVRWINTYGPTEISICATAYEPQWERGESVPENIPIGRPLANVRVYVLDENLQPVPVGTTGELHVGGVGVAQGYLNRPELTAEKFISDPFSSEPGARLYKTGDRARYLASGDIEFLGRGDDQIKIRGFRVELGEIETLLAKHPGVRQGVVIAREDVPGDKRLVGYLVPAAGQKPSTHELREYLLQQLPDHMVPSTFVLLSGMPLTPNGKINRRGLPAPEFEASPEGFALATDGLQLQLVKVWEEVIGHSPIGIRDNFFELGGHSLMAARLMHRIGRALGKTLPLAMLFQAPTIEQLATLLRQNDWSQHWSSLVPIQPRGSQPPFFCIHGVGGNVLGFQNLARCMAPDFPFYGLQSQGLDGKRPCHATVEAMATHYISEVRAVQPHGPYCLGGFSFGGLVAYEMAQQLLAAGEETALLVLFDTYPGELEPIGASLIKLLLRPSRQHWFHDVPKRIKKRIRRTIRGIGVPKLLRDVRNVNRAAATRYVLRPYPGKATLVRAAEKSLRSSADPHRAWGSLVDRLEVHEIASDHYDILIEPRVRDLAEYLKHGIQRAQSMHEMSRANLPAGLGVEKSFEGVRSQN